MLAVVLSTVIGVAFKSNAPNTVLSALGVMLLATVFIAIMSAVISCWRQRAADRQRLEFVDAYWQQKSVLPSNRLKSRHWCGWRIFVVERKVKETDAIVSLYLRPHDGKALSAFHPGQFVTVQIKTRQGRDRLSRCYSLSDAHDSNYYRISIKREDQGQVSNYLHEQIEVGDMLDVMAPTGDFYLGFDSDQPLVLIAGGVGITPFLSMINTLVAREDDREVYLFYGVKNSDHLMMRDYLEALAKKWRNFHVFFCFSRPLETDSGYRRGRITIDLIRTVLPTRHFHFYLCGSLSMMRTLSDELQYWGVPDGDIFFESFGGRRAAIEERGERFPVFFKRSNQRLEWTTQKGTLLELAESHSISMASACRAGQCGLCQIKLIEGEVVYLADPVVAPDPGCCLSCLSVPGSELVIDA